MSDTSYDDVLGGETEAAARPQGPADLRAALEKANAEKAELRRQLAERDAADRTARVEAFLKAKGLPDSAKAEIGDRDPEDWYKAHVAIFGPAAPETEPAGTETTAPVGASALSTDQQEQIAAVTGVQALPFDPKNLASRDAYLDAATSEDDYLKRAAEVGLLAS